MSRQFFAVVVTVTLTVASATAATLSSLATMAVQGAVVALARDYRAQTGHEVAFQFDTGPNLARRIGSGQRGDVLIAPAAVVEQAVEDGRVLAETVTPVGQVAVGVATGRTGRVAALTSADALKAALLGADAVLYSQGTSGVYVEKLLTDLGVMPAIAAKTTRLANGEMVLERIATMPGTVVGFTMVSEIKFFADRGVVLVGPLPAPLQNLTTYVAAVMTGSPSLEAARGFVQFITSPSAKRTFAATGWQ